MNNTVSFLDAAEDPEQLRLDKILQMKKSTAVQKPLKAPEVVAAGDGK